MSTPEAITLAVALLGAVLGIINTWYTLINNKVRVKVIPKIAFPVSRDGSLGNPTLSIDVINLSYFPITIQEVGFATKYGVRKERGAITNPLLLDNNGWPRKLESRESVSVYCDPRVSLDPGLTKFTKAYASTACGVVSYGSSPALKQYLSTIKNIN